MTADELRTILDRFNQALTQIDKWARLSRGEDPIGIVPLYDEIENLHDVWDNLNREYALMKDAEIPGAIKPTRPLPPPPPYPLPSGPTPSGAVGRFKGAKV